jgi:translation initiation factor 5
LFGRSSDPTKFFGFELGALTNISNDRYIVNGKHSAEDLANLLDQFIEKFVLCKYDRNPETVMQITPKGDIELHCKACGHVTPVDMTHKLATYILNNPPSKGKTPTKHSQVSGKQMRREAKKSKAKDASDDESDNGNDTKISTKSTTNQSTTENDKDQKREKSDSERSSGHDRDEEDDNEVWTTDTSADAVRRRQLEVFGSSEIAKRVLSTNTDTDRGTETENEKSVSSPPPTPTEFDSAKELTEYFNKQKPKPNEFYTKVTKIAEIEGWTDRKLITTVFSVLFEKNIVEQLKSRKEFLAPFVKDSTRQKIVLLCLEKLAVTEPSVINKITYILNTLYDADILEEEIILKWFEHPNKKLDPNISTQLRSKAKPFIEWLKNAEEESD